MFEEVKEKGANSTVVQGDRRGAIRVSTDCPAIYRVVNTKDPSGENKKKEHFYKIPPLHVANSGENLSRRAEEVAPELLDMLLWLDWKTSFIIKRLSKREDEEIFPRHATFLNISSTGMLFFSTALHSIDEILEFNFIFPVVPFQEMMLIGRVVRSQVIFDGERPCGAETGVFFIGINEVDREHVIRYVVKRQMQIQRERQK